MYIQVQVGSGGASQDQCPRQGRRSTAHGGTRNPPSQLSTQEILHFIIFNFFSAHFRIGKPAFFFCFFF